VTDFAINIIVDPSKSATGNKQVQEQLDATKAHATIFNILQRNPTVMRRIQETSL